MGSVNRPSQCSYELWTGKDSHLVKFPIIPFGSVVMAHILLDQHTVETGRSVLHYAEDTSLGHRGGLRLFDPKTKREVIRRTYKVLGHDPEHVMTAEDDFTVPSVSIDTQQ